MKMGYIALSLLFALFALLTPLPVQADEPILEWAAINKPGLANNIVVTPSEVSEIAVASGGIIYALDTSANATKSSKVYQSVNGGASWVDITSNLLSAGAVLPATKIAVAPDRAVLVVAVTNNDTGVYMSLNGGGTWTNTNVPGLVGKIQAIAISKQYIQSGTLVSEIVIGTAEWGNNTTTGQVWVAQIGSVLPLWQNQKINIDQTDMTQIGGEVSAIAYPPNYPLDKTLIVVASTSSDVAGAFYQSKTWLCLGQRNTVAGTTSWNNPVFSGYPVEVGTPLSPSAGDAIGVSQIFSSLGVPSDYSTSDTDLMQLFVSYDRTTDANDDVYRIEDTIVDRLNAGGGVVINLSSIAYYGTTTAGKLIAGDMNPVAGSPTVQVHRMLNPFNALSTWHLAILPPTGPGHAQVSWSPDGSSAYCGTGQSPGVALDESAFSASTDDGNNWQQLNLIDTALHLSDITVTPDSNTLFLATYSDSGIAGVWRSTLTQYGIGAFWSRQLTISTTSQRLVLRLSPDYPSDFTIYAFEAGGNLLAVSHNQGNSWQRHIAPGAVIDSIAAGGNTFYVALAGGYIYRTTDDSFTWGQPVSTRLTDINMLTITSNGTILVGGRNGEVAYSTNGGASFILIHEIIGSGDVQVAADTNYQENGIIYAATNGLGNGIFRWKIGFSTTWERIDKSIAALETGQRIGGLATGPEGILYVLRMESAGGIIRSLNPTASGDYDAPEFDVTNQALPADAAFDSSTIFSHTLPYLKLATGTAQNDLWSIDTIHEIIYRFEDTLADNTPVQTLPVNTFQDMVNSMTGRARDICFSWNAPSLDVTNYEMDIYIDAACTNLVNLCNIASTSSTVTVIIGPYQSATSNQRLEYAPATTYYWRVRATAPLKSPWSETFNFTVESIPALVPDLLSPQNRATDISQTPVFSWDPVAGTSDYQLELDGDASHTSPIVSTIINNARFAMTEKLDYGETYFWRVRAISPVESDWSTIASFTVKEAPTDPSPSVIVQAPTSTINNLPAPTPIQETALPLVPSPPPSSTAPATILAIIGIGSILVISIIVLIVKTTR